MISLPAVVKLEVKFYDLKHRTGYAAHPELPREIYIPYDTLIAPDNTLVDLEKGDSVLALVDCRGRGPEVQRIIETIRGPLHATPERSALTTVEGTLIHYRPNRYWGIIDAQGQQIFFEYKTVLRSNLDPSALCCNARLSAETYIGADGQRKAAYLHLPAAKPACHRGARALAG